MSIRIRVYPQGYNSMGGLGGYGGFGMNRLGGAVSAQTFYSNQLSSQKRLSNLQLGYERALWNERLDKVRLEERLKNPYAQVSPYGAYGGINPYGWGAQMPVSNSWLGGSMLGSSGFFGGLGLGGMF